VPANYLIAHDQFKLPIAAPVKKYTAQGPQLKISDRNNLLTASSSKVSFVFDKKTGIVTSYKVDGIEYFQDGFGIQPNFWRAPSDNDYGNGAPTRLQVWKQSSKDFNVVEATIEKEGQTAVIHANYLLAAGNLYMVTYKIYPTGVVNVDAHFTSVSMEATPDEISEATKSATFSPKSQAAREAAAKLEVPRIGVRFLLPADMQQVQYFGRGPEENYLDRQAVRL